MIREKFEPKTTLLEYIELTLETWDKSPFNEIDALILSQLTYLNVDRLVPDLQEDKPWVPLSFLYKAEEFEHMVTQTLTPQLNIQLLQLLCASPRFRDIKLNFQSNKYDKDTEEQFSALSFQLTENLSVVAYRGTDLTVTGWKEDFNMFFISPVPSQLSAVAYLEEVAPKLTGDIYLTGHSKGGNLAVYSSAFCENTLHHRIKLVYNLDGPGFPTDILECSDYIQDHEKVIKIVPEGSMIGILFENAKDPIIIKSHNLSFLQHDPFSWKCDTHHFIKSPKFTNHIQHLDKTLNQWVYELDISQRKTLVDTLFTVISSMNIETIDEFSSFITSEKEMVLKTLKEIDPHTSQCIKEMMQRLIEISFKSRFESHDEGRLNKLLTKLLPQ